ncbi:hypothetical protein ABZ508_01180 [Streptomyces lavendulocolor]|jgi:hypothetical protein|uniref:Uncharacterized protein n=1 Tax=Streptomyces lavendulocolor TaxID=67316 RepID=A0ABV2VXH0_9ACTN
MSEADVGKAQEMVAAAARVRVYMIRQFGVSASDEARQPDRLCEDVLKNIGSSIDEVARLATDWRSLQREEMLYLRRLKNILTPLTEIADLLNPADSIHDEIAPWLALRPRLP